MLKIILITGISGSGKTIALRTLEDISFICIDNLPMSFLKEFINHAYNNQHERLAISIDSRSIGELKNLPCLIENINQSISSIKVIFLDAKDDVIVKRYSESRRRHPLTDKLRNIGKFPSLLSCITAEREILSTIRDYGYLIDTSDLTPRQLKSYIKSLVTTNIPKIVLTFESFSYKNGVPNDADIVFDVRCLPNPYYQSNLKNLTGKDEHVAKWLKKFEIVDNMINDIYNFLIKWLPQYIKETKNYLTVAIGCTGGQHRSVYIVEKLALMLSDYQPLLIRHRAQEKF